MLDAQGAREHDRVLVEGWTLSGLSPRLGRAHVSDAHPLLTAVDAADMLLDHLWLGAGRGDARGLSDQLRHRRSLRVDYRRSLREMMISLAAWLTAIVGTMELLDRVEKEMKDRLEELRPLIREAERLEAALKQLGSQKRASGGAATTGRRPRSATAGATR